MATDIKQLSIQVTPQGITQAATQLEKLAKKAAMVREPIADAKMAITMLNKTDFTPIAQKLKAVSEQAIFFKGTLKGLAIVSSEFKGTSNSLTSIATAAERMGGSVPGLAFFSQQLRTIRQELEGMKGLTIPRLSVSTSARVATSSVGTARVAKEDAVATDNVTASSKRLMAQLIRESEQVGRTRAEFLELRAAKAGLSAEAAPYIARLKQAEKQTQSLGMSAKATDAALRMVPAQFTDIVTQLAGGQNPFLVMLQQGGQMRDMFHGFIPMFKAVGGMIGRFVMSAAGGMTLLGAAVAGVGYAVYKGSEEITGYGKALALTNGNIGLARASFSDFTKELAAVSGGQANAAETLTVLAATGINFGNSLKDVTASVAMFAQITGAETDKVAAEFVKLSKDPVAGLLDLNEKYRDLTATTYEQVKALQEAGNSQKAAELAMQAHARGLDVMTQTYKANMGTIESFWERIKEGAREAKNALLNLGRPEGTNTRIQEIDKQLEGLKGYTSNAAKATVTRLEAERAILIGEQKQTQAIEYRDNLRKQGEQQAITAMSEADKLRSQFATKEQQQKKQLAALDKAEAAAKKTLYGDELKNRLAELADTRKNIIERNAPKGAGIKSTDTKLAALKAEREALEKEVSQLEEYKGGYDKVTEATKRLAAIQELIRSGKGKKEEVASLKEQERYLIDIVALTNRKTTAEPINEQIKKWQDVDNYIRDTTQSLKDQEEELKNTNALADSRTKTEKLLARAKAESTDPGLDVHIRAAAASKIADLEATKAREDNIKASLNLHKIRKQGLDAELEYSNTLQNQLESQQKELEWMQLSNKEREKAQEVWAVEVDYRKQVLELNKQLKALEGKTSPADEQSRQNLEQQLTDLGSFKDAQIAQIQAYNKAKESGLSFYGDTEVAFKNWADSLESRQATIQSAFTNSFSAMEDAFMNFCQGSEVSVKGLFKTILQEMLRVQVKSTTSGFASLFSGLLGGGSGDFASTAGNSSAAGSASAGFGFGAGTINAVGNVYSRSGLKKFAKGGSFTNSIVSSPTLFAFARGAGLMGEAGPEAIMPLTRDGQGNLGVRSQGSQGNVQNNVSVSVNITDGNSSASVTSEQDGKALGEAISNAVKAEMIKQSRAGGILDKGRSR